MNETIKSLYYGDATPFERQKSNSEEYKRLLHEAAEASQKIVDSLNEQQKELFEDYVTKNGAANAERECSSFVEGFGFGIRLVIEAMGIK